MSFFIVDRFEGDYAVLEQREKVFDVPRLVLPSKTKEGDTIEIKISRSLKIKYDDLFEKEK